MLPVLLTFIPGAAGLGAFWDPVIAQLPDGFTARTHDLPGLGAAPAIAQVARYDDLVAHVLGQIDRPTVLVAQSMGAYVALAAALRDPDRILGLVLTAASGGVDMARAGAADWRGDYAVAYPHAEPWAGAMVPDLTARLRDIQCPTMLIWATADALSPMAVAEALAAGLPQASLVTFETDDHWVARRFAPEVAATIASFARTATGA